MTAHAERALRHRWSCTTALRDRPVRRGPPCVCTRCSASRSRVPRSSSSRSSSAPTVGLEAARAAEPGQAHARPPLPPLDGRVKNASLRGARCMRVSERDVRRSSERAARAHARAAFRRRPPCGRCATGGRPRGQIIELEHLRAAQEKLRRRVCERTIARSLALSLSLAAHHLDDAASCCGARAPTRAVHPRVRAHRRRAARRVGGLGLSRGRARRDALRARRNRARLAARDVRQGSTAESRTWHTRFAIDALHM